MRRLFPAMSGRSVRARGFGLAIILVGAVALATPWAASEWLIELLGAFLLIVGAVALVHVVKKTPSADRPEGYAGAVIAILAGLLLFALPVLALAAAVRLLAGLVVAAGLWNLARALGQRPRPHLGLPIVSGLLTIVLGVLLWRLGPAFGEVAIAIALGVWMIVTGWRILLVRGDDAALEGVWTPGEHHPDPRLGLPANPEIGRRARSVLEYERHRWRIDLAWVVTLAVVFFLTHSGRMDLPWSFFGAASTGVAVVGDLVTAILITVVLLLPACCPRGFWCGRVCSGPPSSRYRPIASRSSPSTPGSGAASMRASGPGWRRPWSARRASSSWSCWATRSLPAVGRRGRGIPTSRPSMSSSAATGSRW